MENTKMRFSAERYISTMFGGEKEWWNQINGKEVEFTSDSNLGRCECYLVLKEWCEPINDSDNNDK